MAGQATYLSPNGQNRTTGNGPATRMLVATLRGVATLERDDRDAPWEITGRTLEDRHVGSLLYEPRSGKLFAGAHAGGGIWVSDDGDGRSWRPLANGIDRPHIYCLNARYGSGVTLFAGTSPAGLYRSDDLGEHWTEVKSILAVPDTDKWTFPPPPHIPHVKNVVFHPRREGTIYVLVEQGAVLKSVDDGANWIELSGYSKPEDVAYRDMHRLLIHPDDDNLFFLATGEGLYRSADGGASWTHLVRRGDRMGYPDFLFADPDDSDTLYMGGSYLNPSQWYKAGIAESTVLRSTDRGDSWTELAAGLPVPMVGAFEAMTLHTWPGGMMLAVGTATGEVYVSEDRARSWKRVDENVTPVSKDDHHFPFMSEEARRAAMAVRGL